MKIKISFDQGWFFAGKDHMLSVMKTVELLRREVDRQIRVVEKSLNECVLDFPDVADPEATNQQIRTLIRERICSDASSDQPFQLIRMDGDAAGDGKAGPAPKREPDRPAQAPASKPEGEAARRSALEEANEMVGVDEFKQLCRSIHARARLICENGTQDAFLSTAYLFVGNAGFGCEKAISILSTLLREEGLFTSTAEIARVGLRARPDPLLKDDLIWVCKTPKPIVVDLGPAMDRTQSVEFKQMLLELFRLGKKCLVIFRAPYLGKEKTRQLVEDLHDVLSVRPVVFPLFTDKELRELAELSLNAYGFSAEPQAWEDFQKVIEQESMDGYFYGVHTVRKIVNEMIQAEEHLRAKEALDEDRGQRISAEAVKQLLRQDAADSNPGLDELEQMIGMADVADQVKEMIRMAALTKNAGLADRQAMHMCFTGNPGTGKTTVARIIGAALKEAGVLRIGKFVEHHARDLCGQYIGETAKLTASICRDAYGSVLFLDEAYALTASDSPRDYGKEAIDALIAQMENHREDLVVIVAGYPQEMERFLDANPGMRTRIPYHIRFPNYTTDELYAIFRKMAGKRFRLGEGFLEHAEAFFAGLPKELLESRSFGNGRFVRNLYERTCSKAAMRSTGAGVDDLVLEIEDFDAAAAEQPLPKQRSVAQIGF